MALGILVRFGPFAVALAGLLVMAQAGARAGPGQDDAELHPNDTVRQGEPTEEASFTIYFGDEVVGTERLTRYDGADGYTLRTRTKMTSGERDLAVRGELTLDHDWHPVSGNFIIAEPEGLSTAILRTDGNRLVRVEQEAGGGSQTEQAEQDIDLYLGHAVSHLAPLCHMDRKDLSAVSVFPGRPTRVAAMVGQGEHPETKEQVSVAIYLLNPGAQSAVLAICEDDKLILTWVPGLGLMAARDGYEQLAHAIRDEWKDGEGMPDPEQREQGPVAI